MDWMGSESQEFIAPPNRGLYTFRFERSWHNQCVNEAAINSLDGEFAAFCVN